MHFSSTYRAFYDVEIHGESIPDDAVEITSAEHAELLAAQSAGKMIVGGENGYPIAIEQPKPVRTKDVLMAEVAARRWQVETGGIIVGGSPVATDREAQSMLSSTYSSLLNGPIADTAWKSSDGSFTMVTLAELKQVAQAAAEHVRACFSAERLHVETISAMESQAELDAYDVNTGWPSNT